MTTNGTLILLAAWLQGAIALALLWRLGVVRVPLVTSGKISMGAVALSREAWPDRVTQVSNAFDNQFQLPVLFYVGCGTALLLAPTVLEVVLAWLFVLSRVVHAVVHITSNHVAQRFSAYTAGFVVLAVLWIDLLVRLILAAVHSGA